MIEGIKFDITSKELQEHLSKKIAYHTERQKWYSDQVESLTKGGVQPTGYSGGDPLKALQDKSADHKRRVEVFTFLKDHLIPETYRLDEKDLSFLEIVSRYW